MKTFLAISIDENGDFTFASDYVFPIADGEKAFRVDRKDSVYQELAMSLGEQHQNIFNAIEMLTSAAKDAKLNYFFLNVELEEELKKWRRKKAVETKVPFFMIMSQKVLYRIADDAPSNEEELLAIPGFGQKMLEHCGAEILEIIGKYSKSL